MSTGDREVTAPAPGQTARILPAYDAVGERELSEAVHQALGFASVCWEPMDCTGVFEESRVRQVADELTAIIGQYADAIAAQERPAPDRLVRLLMDEMGWDDSAQAAWLAGTSGDPDRPAERDQAVEIRAGGGLPVIDQFSKPEGQ